MELQLAKVPYKQLWFYILLISNQRSQKLSYLLEGACYSGLKCHWWSLLPESFLEDVGGANLLLDVPEEGRERWGIRLRGLTSKNDFHCIIFFLLLLLLQCEADRAHEEEEIGRRRIGKGDSDRRSNTNMWCKSALILTYFTESIHILNRLRIMWFDLSPPSRWRRICRQFFQLFNHSWLIQDPSFLEE